MMTNDSAAEIGTEKRLTTNDHEEENPQNRGDGTKKPGSRAINLIKAALSILRMKGGGKPPTAPPPSTTTNASALTKLVVCVRPLYLKGGCIGGPTPPEESSGMTSRYASAQSLCDLDDGGAANDNGRVSNAEVFHDGIADEMIDAKADLFIAKFYEQMKNDHQLKQNRD